LSGVELKAQLDLNIAICRLFHKANRDNIRLTMARALLSVSDKTGIIDFATVLSELGYELISTGGTFLKLEEAGLSVRQVADVTGFPEILEGRVKTLHPSVHGGVLAKRSYEHLQELAEHSITPIDIVVVNLYPFRETIAP